MPIRVDPIELPEPGVLLAENSGMMNTPAGRIPAGDTAARHPQPTGGSIFWDGTLRQIALYDADTGLWVLSPNTDDLAALQAQVDALPGFEALKKVRVATTAARTLASDFEVGDTIDGVVLVLSDRVLIKDQAAGAENGVYTVNLTGTPTRATDADSESELVSAIVVVSSGTANHDKVFMCTNDTVTVDTTALTFIVLPDITAAVAAEAALRTTADTTEATARAAADTSEASTRATADTTNATAITAEATTRAAAITTEATARAAADTTEATARASADTSLTAAIATAKTEAIAEAATNPLIARLHGKATMVDGLVDVTDHDADATDVILLTHETVAGVPGILYYTIDPGNKFTIKSTTTATDDNIVSYAVFSL